STQGLERMRISANGNVGIGTTSPDQKLTVDSGHILVKSGGLFYGLNPTNTEGFQIYQDATSTIFRSGTGSNKAILFRQNATDYMAISTIGNVGIGTTGPGAKLSISTWTGTAPSGFNPILSLAGGMAGNNTQGHSIDFEVNNAADYPHSRIVGTMTDGTGGEIQFHTTPNYTTTVPTARMTINNGGNVGIGTTTVGARLTIQQSSDDSNGGVRIIGTAGGLNYNDLYVDASGTFYIRYGVNGNSLTLNSNGTIRGATYGFGGIYRPTINTNPFTGAYDCPSGFSDFDSGIGSPNLHICYK
ncbi:MAG: hypothetical protein AAB453_04340, partial [Patescibacteria group bacterium]